MPENPLYRRWNAMRNRCYNPAAHNFRWYGAKGIVMCSAWRESFHAFAEWAIAAGWAAHLELDRIDNTGPYSPENCQFISHDENVQKQPQTKRLAAFGEIKTLKEWVTDERCAVSLTALRARVFNYGWDIERALTEPMHAEQRRERS